MKAKKVEDVFECICGGVDWVIAPPKILCSKCGQEFRFPSSARATNTKLPNAQTFNERWSLGKRAVLLVRPAKKDPK